MDQNVSREVIIEGIMNKNVLETLMNRVNHEMLSICNIGGKLAYIAIHSTELGPALGGCRFKEYEDDFSALKDALNLAEAMTYKASAAGLDLGGGKTVISANPKKYKNEFTLRQFGRYVNALSGKYITAEDVGTTSSDMEIIRKETRWVTGLPEYMGGGGDPSPFTAYGVFIGIKAACKYVYGSESLKNKKIFVQGVGNVGSNLVKLLKKEDAYVLISDIDEKKMEEVAKKYGCEIVSNTDITQVSADIFAPCALGEVITIENVDNLKFQIIAGAANNQLEDNEMCAKSLKKKKIYYVPDFIINAGGLINCYCEVIGNYSSKLSYALTEKIYDRVLYILKEADNKNVSTYEIAIKLALERLQIKKKMRM